MKDFFTRFEGYVLPEPNSGCWLWTKTALPRVRASAYSGYGWFRINGVYHYAHRAAYEAVHGDGSAADLVVRHRCDNPICVNPDHLEIGTAKDNAQDRIQRGRSNNGARNGMSKFTLADATTAKVMAGFGFYQREVADLFDVDQSAISLILTGRRWGKEMADVPLGADQFTDWLRSRRSAFPQATFERAERAVFSVRSRAMTDEGYRQVIAKAVKTAIQAVAA
jgi:hypothetical protein